MAGQAGVYVNGLRELRRDLRKVAPELLPVLNQQLKQVVDTVVLPRVVSKMPRKTGDAQNSVRSVSLGNRGAGVRAGGAKVPYYGWLDFGGVLLATGGRRNTISRPALKKGRYIYPSIDESTEALAEGAAKATDTILDRFARSGP